MTEIPRAEHGYFLLSLEEPEVNELRIVLIEAASEPHGPTPIGYGHEITTVSTAHYEVFWGDYIAYAVRNERYARARADDAPETPQLRERPGSPFLDYIGAATTAGDLHAGALSHWELVCLDHVIDVVSATPPMVSRMP